MGSTRLYHREPYTRSFTASVLSCDAAENGLYAVSLEDTAFFPEGGGQPFDTGKIGDANVVSVYEKGGVITHYVDSPLSAGSSHMAEIDWGRRFDHMQRHTAEHVITGVIHRLKGADNVGFNIGPELVTMDYNVFLTPDDIKEAEYLSNEAVFRNIPVIVNYYDNTPQMDYRSKKELTGEIRIVTVPDIDVCACCGIQTRTTGEVGLIKIVSAQKYKGGSRLYMVCGARALNDYNIKQKNAEYISELLSCKLNETKDAVAALAAERDRLKYDIISINFRLIDFIAGSIPEAPVICVFEDAMEPDGLRRLVSAVAKRSDIIDVCAAFSGNDANGYRYALIIKNDGMKPLAKRLNEALNGKGGGKDVAMGSVHAKKEDIEAFFADYNYETGE